MHGPINGRSTAISGMALGVTSGPCLVLSLCPRGYPAGRFSNALDNLVVDQAEIQLIYSQLWGCLFPLAQVVISLVLSILHILPNLLHSLVAKCSIGVAVCVIIMS